MENILNKKGGISILGILVFTLVIILVLSYFKVNLRSAINSPEGQNNINYVTQSGKNLWEDHLKEPTMYFWDNYIKKALAFLLSDISKIFFKSIADNFKNMISGKGTGLENMAPAFQFSSGSINSNSNAR